MDFTFAWQTQTTKGSTIGQDRRRHRRYQLQLDLKWKLIRRRRVLDTGIGQTIDVSSGGILFDAGRHLPEGMNVELSIMWPVLLHDVAPMQLVVSGRIVRSRDHKVAVRTTHHEFRTVGVRPENRDAPVPGLPILLTCPAVYATLCK
jgi:hypothetical protein